MKTFLRKTAISWVKSDRILLRGYPIDELAGNISWAGAVYLALVGELPEPKVARLFEAVLVSVVDHGPTPASTLAACTVASTGSPLASSVAAGILAIAKSHGGAIEDCMNVLERCVNLKQDPDKATATVAREYRDRGLRVPGFGHRQHSADPRSARLLGLAGELGLSGNYVAHAQSMDRVLSEIAGKPVPLNADGAIAALLCEIAFPKAAANGIFMIARVPGLVAHCLEEQARNPPLRPIDPAGYEYDGPAERSPRQADKTQDSAIGEFEGMQS
jgi:citrate synthase